VRQPARAALRLKEISRGESEVVPQGTYFRISALALPPLCEIVERANATAAEVLDVFQDARYRVRVALFHFSGHAGSGELLFESPLRGGGKVGARGGPHPALSDPVAKEFLDFGVTFQKEDEEILGAILEEEAQGQVAAALEKAVTQLANAHPTVAMRLAEGLGQLDKREQALDALGFVQLLQFFKDARVKGEKLLQGALSTQWLRRSGAFRSAEAGGTFDRRPPAEP
jgi:hypothetical protein